MPKAATGRWALWPLDPLEPSKIDEHLFFETRLFDLGMVAEMVF